MLDDIANEMHQRLTREPAENAGSKALDDFARVRDPGEPRRRPFASPDPSGSHQVSRSGRPLFQGSSALS